MKLLSSSLPQYSTPKGAGNPQTLGDWIPPLELPQSPKLTNKVTESFIIYRGQSLKSAKKYL
jgi:hypothetical protein